MSHEKDPGKPAEEVREDTVGVVDGAEAVELRPEMEILSADVYTGTVVSVETGRYCFIGQVRRGFESVATNGDVFCPNGDFIQGDLVEFHELNHDLERPGKFRTEAATRIVEGALVATSEEARVVALRTMSQPSPYHVQAKEVDPGQSEEALLNQPFLSLVEQIMRRAQSVDGLGDLSVIEMAEQFIGTTFPSLTPFGVSSKVDGTIDETAEKAAVDQAVTAYREAGMAGQAESIQAEYARCSGVRQVFTLMQTNGILKLDTVIPIRHLPDLLVANPVWFIDAREGLPDLSQENDPHPDEAIKYFCEEVGTKEFAWLYQIYNRRTRALGKFSGRDIMPLALMEVMKQARKVFDFTVITTPYHDIASREWADPNWQRNIDPMLFGFLKGLPYMFLLGRWSGTGLFPLMADMIADTINHLRLRKSGLSQFADNSWWHRGQQQGGRVLGEGHLLEAFADQVITSFEAHKLFEFLRGEWSPETEA